MIKYCFDGYIKNHACGWIADLSTPGKKMHVAVVIGGEIFSVSEASNYRSDLEAAGYADGKFGFAIPLPASLEGDCHLEIVESKKILEESRFKVTVIDSAAALLFRGKDFSGYQQFISAHKAPKTDSNHRGSSRLSEALSRCLKRTDGLQIPQHAIWAIERNRRGGANFFTPQAESTWADFAWYLFDYREDGKTDVTITADNPLIQVAATPPLKGLSPLYLAWLLRTGQQVLDISMTTTSQRCAFLGSLISAKVTIPDYDELTPLKRLISKRPTKTKLRNLPRMTKYLQWKYETGHTAHYDLTTDLEYLSFLFDATLHASSFELEFVGPEVLDFFKEAISLVDGKPSRFEFLIWLYSQKINTPSFSISENIRALDITTFFQNRWLALHPEHKAFSSTNQTSPQDHSHSVYIVAHWNSASGLTQNALMSSKTFAKLGIQVIKLHPSGELYVDPDPISLDARKTPIILKKNIILLHINADDAPEPLARIARTIDIDAAHVIGFYLWELEEVPKAHFLGLELVDEIWTPTKFVHSAYSRLHPQKTKLVKKALQVPERVNRDPKKFGIPDGGFSFLLSFDYHSCTERKNPIVAVQGFLEAFPADENVSLVVKTTEFAANHWGDPFLQWQAVRALAELDSRIILIEDFLDNDDFFTLINTCDAVVSTHRSEGFGYLPAYALWLEKSLVVTNYSGTEDFCTATNSFLVEYDLVPTPGAKFVYSMIRPMWAEVRMDSLIKQYRACRDSMQASRKKASETIMTIYSFAALAETYEKTLAASGAITTEATSINQ
jgi:hypothetical protein